MRQQPHTYDVSHLNDQQLKLLLGSLDEHLHLLEEHFHLKIYLSSQHLHFEINEDSKLQLAMKVLTAAVELIQSFQALEVTTFIMLIDHVKQGLPPIQHLKKIITTNANGKPIVAKTYGQALLVEALQNKDMVFALGPAGTGKTYISVVYAVNALKLNHIKKIILTRPAVEAGENLGFLPGDLKEKVDPYLRPLYDALYDMLGMETTNRYIEKGTIEIAPLAYMRGRTLDQAFVILDEAQNTTTAQMKMFLTRMGNGAHMVINGDLTQVDLKKDQKSGLQDAADRLQNIPEIAFVTLSDVDVVRHPIVKKILKRYE
ncbi:MAG: PhoH family protein [Erysipelothrix sp.]|jgi:phosphate starvation-inducible PhoH-like protein|nr:PhoH family protein [Erysipelothrix sp.]